MTRAQHYEAAAHLGNTVALMLPNTGDFDVVQLYATMAFHHAFAAMLCPGCRGRVISSYHQCHMCAGNGWLAR